MLRFEVFDDQGPARSWPLVNAHLLGRDDLPVAGSVEFSGGEIVCAPREKRATALCLEYDAGPMGRLMLQTCLLALRPEPYRLNQELARHRIKHYIAKSEEWLMFDPALGGEALKRWEQARTLFTEALVMDESAASERRCRDALVAALDAGERLAMSHAQILLHRRFATRPASRTTLGVRVDVGLDPAKPADLLRKEFDVLVIPTPWARLQPRPDAMDFAELDRWMLWGRQAGKPIVAGPLLGLTPGNIPAWAAPLLKDPTRLRDALHTFMEQVVYRYREIVGIWNVASGLHANSGAQLDLEQMVDLTRRGSLLVRQSRKGARTLVEVTEPFGDHVARRPGAVTPWEYLERVVQEGIQLDCLGVQLVFGDGAGGRTTRDLLQISTILDRFFLLEYPLLVSALGVPSRTEDQSGGWWRGEWTAESQGSWASRVLPIALSKPYVESVFWDRLVDGRGGGLPASTGVLDDAGRPKPVLSRLVAVRRRLREPLGPLQGAAADAAVAAPGEIRDSGRERD